MGGGHRVQECHRPDPLGDAARVQRRQESLGEGGPHGDWGHEHLGRDRARAVRGSAEGPPGPLRRRRPRPEDARRRLCQFLRGNDGQSAARPGDRDAPRCEGPSSSSGDNGTESAYDSAGHMHEFDGQAQQGRASRDLVLREPPGDLAGRMFDSRQQLLAQLRGGPSIWPQSSAGDVAEKLGEDRRWGLRKRSRLASFDEAAAGMSSVGGGANEDYIDTSAARGGDTVSIAGHRIRGRPSPGATDTSASTRGGDIAASTSGHPSQSARGCSSAATDHAAARVAWHCLDAGFVESGAEGS